MNPPPQQPSRATQVIQVILVVASLIIGFFIGLIALIIAIGGVTIFFGIAWWRRRKARSKVVETSYRVIDR